jgi:nucleoside phosphorylase
MADSEKSLEGWVPEPDGTVSLAQIIDLAFDYRGNTTVVKRDGSEVAGYIFNRMGDGGAPFIEMFDAAGTGPFRIAYAEIATIRFDGRDTAAGNSYAAWLRRKEADRPRREAPARQVDRLLVLTALEWEARELARRLGLAPVASTPWSHFATPSSSPDPAGPGLELMPVGLRAALLEARWHAGGPPPDLVVSAGLGGALAPALAVGVLLIPDVVLVAGGGSMAVDGPAQADAVAAARRAGCRVSTDPVVEVTDILATPEAKAMLRRNTGAAGADLESAAILRTARKRGVPAVVIRGVSDTASQRLAPELTTLLDSAGGVRPASAVALAVRRPSLIPNALALRRGAGKALDAVAAALRHLQMRTPACPTR